MQCKCGHEAIEKTSSKGTKYFGCPNAKFKKENGKFIVTEGCDFMKFPDREPVHKTGMTQEQYNNLLQAIKVVNGNVKALADFLLNGKTEEVDLKKIPFD